MTSIHVPDERALPTVADADAGERGRMVRQVVAIAVALLVTSLVVRLLDPARSVDSQPHVSWLALTAAFGLAELFVMNVQVSSEARTISLSEAPLVLGLFVSSSGGLVAARLLGPMLVLLLLRRQPLLKLVFNACQMLTEVVVATAVFDAVLGTHAATSPVAWLATYVALGAGGAIGAVSVATVVSLAESGRTRWHDLRAALRSSGAVSAVVGTFALVGLNALQRDARTWWLILLSAMVMLGAYRAYASLSERHLTLELLYDFSAYLNHTHEADEVLRRVLLQARELLHAEHTEIVFRPSAVDGHATRLTLDNSDHVVRSDVPFDELHRTALGGAPLLVPHTTRDPAMRRLIRGRGFREAICVPLVDDDDTPLAAVVAADRLGRVRSFDGGDVRLLQTVANHAGMALRNSELIDRLVHAAQHDVLTGLANRSLLQQRIQESLDRLHAGRLPGLAVLLLDLDGFKDVNDALGHHSGDVLLQVVAQRLRESLRPGELAARLGGDEFAVLLPGTFSPDAARQAGRDLLQRLRAPIDVAGVVVTVGASVGVSLAPQDSIDTSALLKRADLAMYAAKSGSGGVRLFDSGLERPGPRRLTLLAELRLALGNDEIDVHVQPKAALPSGEVDEVEVLVRWQHPRRGLLLPDEFVPLAESAGLIGELTSRVLDLALAHAARWRAAGTPIGVAVNVSARSLDDQELPGMVAAALAVHRVPSDVLTLEITESSIMSDPDRAQELLTELHGQGVGLSIDDFGTGYSSLAYLRQLPVQQVKIDKGLVGGLDADEAGATIVRSIVQLGGDLSLQVVAEGVEDRRVWDELVRLGCPRAQGFLLARPMPAEDFLPWLRGYQARHRDGAGSRVTRSVVLPKE